MDCRFEIVNSFANSPISISKAPRLRQRGLTAKSPKRAKIIEPEPNLEFGTFIGDRQILMVLDIKTCSEAQNLLSSSRFYKNGKPKPEHWTERAARHKIQKKKVFFALVNCKEIIKLPCTIKYTRYAPGFLDEHDNLRISGKYVIDQCCAEITGEYRPGRADSNKGFTFQYDQVKSKKYYVKIEISW